MTSVFDHDDLVRYFDLVQLPDKFGDYQDIPKDLELLTALHIHQISAIPYENLDMHYSESHLVDIDPQNAFPKFCNQKNRGGHCMEINIFFSNMLRAIGFKCYHIGVHPCLLRQGQELVPGGPFIGLSHATIIVILDNGSQYLIDAAFSGDGPTHPMAMIDGETITNLGTQESRLIRSVIPQFDSDVEWWIYQYRNRPDAPWNSCYCFLQVPYLYADFEIMNYCICTKGTRYLSNNVVIVAFTRKDDSINGKLMLVNGYVKRNTGGRTEIIAECRTEEERVAALQEYFGIMLTREQREEIRGQATELMKEERTDLQ